MRLADIVTCFPVPVILIAAFVWLRPVTVREATVVFSLAMWPFAARVFRAGVASLAVEEYVAAARALGASNRRILLRHVLPNAAGVLVISATALSGRSCSSRRRPILRLRRPLHRAADARRPDRRGHHERHRPVRPALGWWTWATPMVALVLALCCINLLATASTRRSNQLGGHSGFPAASG